MNKKLTLNNNSFQMRESRSYSRLYHTMWAVLLLLAVFITGCKKDEFDGEIVGLCPVVTTDPMDKAPDVALDKVITATFNTSMNASTVNGTTFTIKNGTTVIAGDIGPATNGTTFTFTPKVPLAPFTTYTGTITNGVKDTLRTAMVSDYVWTFTTIPQVTTSSDPSGGGVTTGAGLFAQGSTVTVTAIPISGYTFTNWTENGVFASSSPNYQFTMAGNRALVANFSATTVGTFAVNASSSPAAGGTTTGSGSFNTGSTVTVTATPSSIYTFTNWTEGTTVVSSSPNYQFVLTGNRTLVANYTLIPANQFAINLSSSPAAGGTTSGSGSYPSGSSRTVTATANTGYTFGNWTEGATVVSTSAAYTFTLNGNRTLVANFIPNTYTLNVTAVNGTVVKNPNQATYNHGTSVQLTATPASGYIFSSWSGDASGSVNPLTVVMTANRNITANFTALPASILGRAGLYGAFGGNAGITNQGINTVINNGKIGTTAASTLITGFRDGLTGDVYTVTGGNNGLVTGGIFTAPPAPGNAVKFDDAQKALADAVIAYNSISPASRPGGTDPGAGQLGGLVLAPGTYKSAGATFQIKDNDLVLDAKGDPNAVWVFQTAAGLTVGTASTPGTVRFLNGVGSAKNVYWYVGTAAVINYGGGGIMVGTVISTSGVTLSSPGVAVQTVLNGRALSLVASVTMVNTTINVPQ